MGKDILALELPVVLAQSLAVLAQPLALSIDCALATTQAGIEELGSQELQHEIGKLAGSVRLEAAQLVLMMEECRLEPAVELVFVLLLKQERRLDPDDLLEMKVWRPMVLETLARGSVVVEERMFADCIAELGSLVVVEAMNMLEEPAYKLEWVGRRT